MSVITSALIGGASNLLGNLLGYKSQSNANKTNLQIAQMNNEFNERMMQKQMDYNTEMWEKENEYNSAANQRKRLEEAGLNPSLMMNGGSAGIAQSANGVSPAQANGVQVQAFRPDFSGIAQAAQTAAQMSLQKDMNVAQINNLNAQADVARARAMADIGKVYEETKNLKVRNQFEHSLQMMNLQKMNQDYYTSKSQMKYIDEQARNMAAQTLLLDKEISTFDERWNMQKANVAAQTLSYIANANLSHKQAVATMAKALYDEALTEGQKISNDTARKTAEHIIDKAKNDAIPHYTLMELPSVGAAAIGKGIKYAWNKGKQIFSK